MGQNPNRKDPPKILQIIFGGLTKKLATLQAEVNSVNSPKRTLNYINHLNQLPDKTIAKQAFLLSKKLHNEGKESFYSNIINTITSYYNTSNKPNDLETKIENSRS